MANLLMRAPIPYEVKKKNRFIFRFPTALGINEWVIQSGSRPHFTVNEVEIPFLNTSEWVEGRFIWEAMDLTLIDPIGPSTAQAIMEWVRLGSESVTGRQGYAAGYKKDVELEMLDPTGVVVEKWILQGAFITSANFGELSYDDDGLADIALTLRYSRAILVF
jgi:hypothetical protein